MIIPSTLAIAAYRNADYRETFFFTDDNGPMDLTGYDIWMQLRQYQGMPNPAYLDIRTGQVSANGSTCQIMDATGGEFEIFIDHLDWATVPVSDPIQQPKQVYYDIILTEPGGDRYVYLEGTFTLNQGITRE